MKLTHLTLPTLYFVDQKHARVYSPYKLILTLIVLSKDYPVGFQVMRLILICFSPFLSSKGGVGIFGFIDFLYVSCMEANLCNVL